MILTRTFILTISLFAFWKNYILEFGNLINPKGFQTSRSQNKKIYLKSSNYISSSQEFSDQVMDRYAYLRVGLIMTYDFRVQVWCYISYLVFDRRLSSIIIQETRFVTKWNCELLIWGSIHFTCHYKKMIHELSMISSSNRIEMDNTDTKHFVMLCLYQVFLRRRLRYIITNTLYVKLFLFEKMILLW